MSQRPTGRDHRGVSNRGHRVTASPSDETTSPSHAARRSTSERQRDQRGRVRQSGVHAILNPTTASEAASTATTTPAQNARQNSRLSQTAQEGRDQFREVVLSTEEPPASFMQHAGERQAFSSNPIQRGRLTEPAGQYRQPPTLLPAFAPHQQTPYALAPVNAPIKEQRGSSSSDTGRRGGPSTSRAPIARSSYEQQDVNAGQDTRNRSDRQLIPSKASFPMDVTESPIQRSDTLPSAAAGAGIYQLMTLETEHGRVNIPVDIQAASRQADERRRRNAGASARFRARRRERDSATEREIDELRDQIRDLEEDVTFYRTERDHLAQVAYGAAHDRDRHFPRPPSPRLRRLRRPETISFGSMSSISGQESAYEERGERSAQERYSRRRLSGPAYEDRYAGSTPRQQPLITPYAQQYAQIQPQSNLPATSANLGYGQLPPSEVNAYQPPQPQLHRPPQSYYPQEEPPEQLRALEERDSEESDGHG